MDIYQQMEDSFMELEASSYASSRSSGSSSSQVTTPKVRGPGVSPGISDENQSYDMINPSPSSPVAGETDGQPTDLAILSRDAVCFNVHSRMFISSSSNGFNHLLSGTSGKHKEQQSYVLSLPERSIVVAILLHTVYGVSCTHLLPSFDDLVAAVAALKTYGMPLQVYVSRGTPLFDALISHAPSRALALYSLASANDLYDLAATASTHLLSVTITSIPDEVTAQIDPIYLKRLFMFHADRVSTFKQLLVAPPENHEPTPSCTTQRQRDRIAGTWNLIVAYLSFIVRPDMPREIIESTFYGIQNRLPCVLCRHALAIRLQTLIAQWSTVKATI